MAQNNQDQNDPTDVANQQNTEQSLKPAGSKNLLLTILLLFNTVVMGAVAYFQYQSFEASKKKESLKEVVKSQISEELQELGEGQAAQNKIEDDGKLFPLETFTANLAQGEGPRRYIRLNLVLKFSKSSSEEEYTARKPQIRDVIINTLNSKRPKELLSAQGKKLLKEEIKSGINNFLIDGEIRDVYYVGFQVQ